MRAIVCTKYGAPEVLEPRQVAKPAPKDDEVLIRIRAATVSKGDCEIRSFTMHPGSWLPVRLALGVLKPRQPILGQELAGDVEAVGKAVTNFQVGDAVNACTELRFGAYAEYQCLPSRFPIARKPANASYEEAATAPVWATNALHFLRKAQLQKGERILINGAGGCMGTYAVQLAKHAGAEVTAVDSAEKLALLSDLGADHVMDYRKQDFNRCGERYHVILDVVGGSDYGASLRSLEPGGRYLLANVGPSVMLRGVWTSATSGRGGKKVISALAAPTARDLEVVNELIDDGVLRSVIDRSYSLEEMREAHRYVDTDAKHGHVVIRVASG